MNNASVDKQTTPLESDAGRMPGSEPSRGMLARIRKATGEFDFTALISGARTSGAGSQAGVSGTPAGVDSGAIPAEYDPIYRGEPDDPRSSLARLWDPPPPEAPEPELIPIPSWQRANVPESPSIHPVPTICVRGGEPELAPWGARRDQVGYARAAYSRLLLCFWTLLMGICLGVGVGTFVERFTSVRAVNRVVSVSSPAKPKTGGLKPTKAKTRDLGRRTAIIAGSKPSIARAPANLKHDSNPLQPYRAPLAVPVLVAAALSLFWVVGGPQLGGAFEHAAYWLSAVAVFGVALWCGMTTSMITLELRAARTSQGAAIPQSQATS